MEKHLEQNVWSSLTEVQKDSGRDRARKTGSERCVCERDRVVNNVFLWYTNKIKIPS